MVEEKKQIIEDKTKEMSKETKAAEMKAEKKLQQLEEEITQEDIETFKFRKYFGIFTILPLLVLTPLCINHPEKYLRITVDDAKYASCSSLWINPMNENGGYTCCTADSTEAPCYYGMSFLRNFSSVYFSWGLPFVALLIRAVFNFNDVERMKTLRNRFVSYLVLIAFRTFVIYSIFNQMEDQIFRAPKDCWYKQLRKNQECAKEFDYSDHNVMYLVHYFLISVVEWYVTSNEARSNVEKILTKTWLILLNIPVFYSIFYTILYFHDSTENLSSFGIVFAYFILGVVAMVKDRLDFIMYYRKDANTSKKDN